MYSGRSRQTHQATDAYGRRNLISQHPVLVHEEGRGPVLTRQAEVELNDGMRFVAPAGSDSLPTIFKALGIAMIVGAIILIALCL